MSDVKFKLDDLDDAHIVPRKMVPKGSVPPQATVDQALLSQEPPDETTIICINCHKPIFKIKILSPLSHRVIALGSYTYKNGDPTCPRCKGNYYLIDTNGNMRFNTSKGRM